ncbi:TlpA family protein disulfide reductase [Kordia zhangzhouensis]|uniref:TlpA family protein disulfide reductase n=1 Tax=Kordia zhangzhouensis TaxID=1620405 RepID=UPI00069C7F22|nr:TlpA disulfide reductase family protein [Kordia zhangzhouensis]
MMKNILLVIFIFLSLQSCEKEILSEFPSVALQEKMQTIDGETIEFEKILKKYKGNTIFIDIWASWCPDCIEGIPKVKEIQKNHPELTYLFLSLDRKITSWKAGIQKYKLIGEHYYVPSGMKGTFGKAIGINWIPRYMVVNPDGSIKLFEATTTTEKSLLEAIKQ